MAAFQVAWEIINLCENRKDEDKWKWSTQPRFHVETQNWAKAIHVDQRAQRAKSKLSMRKLAWSQVEWVCEMTMIIKEKRMNLAPVVKCLT